ncbi:uncharacterized protein LOC132652906 [Meriones unguiculatus]|uniref:uncharacterized protein LOC132652906 n=1 Tax=Meriones unguiculatus TaxID=10047 RepID=UPI00293F303C|nr:uncharacterized protein LOC132652906 [Meriones unguiculatus]
MLRSHTNHRDPEDGDRSAKAWRLSWPAREALWSICLCEVQCRRTQISSAMSVREGMSHGLWASMSLSPQSPLTEVLSWPKSHPTHEREKHHVTQLSLQRNQNPLFNPVCVRGGLPGRLRWCVRLVCVHLPSAFLLLLYENIRPSHSTISNPRARLCLSSPVCGCTSTHVFTEELTPCAAVPGPQCGCCSLTTRCSAVLVNYRDMRNRDADINHPAAAWTCGAQLRCCGHVPTRAAGLRVSAPFWHSPALCGAAALAAVPYSHLQSVFVHPPGRTALLLQKCAQLLQLRPVQSCAPACSVVNAHEDTEEAVQWCLQRWRCVARANRCGAALCRPAAHSDVTALPCELVLPHMLLCLYSVHCSSPTTNHMF